MKTIEKTIDVLEAFLNQKGEIGLAQLAELTGLNISTTYRIASTLVKRGYLNQLRRGKKYSLSPKLLQFSNIILTRIAIRDIALPYLHKLNKIVNENINLAIFDNDSVVFIESIESKRYLRVSLQMGTIEPLHCCSVGKVLLAHMQDEELERYFHRKALARYTENTITDINKLKQELYIIKQEGVAIDNEEYTLGVKCVGAPVKDANRNVVAAVSITGPSTRLNNERMQELKSLIKRCGLEISRAIGYRGE